MPSHWERSIGLKDAICFNQREVCGASNLDRSIFLSDDQSNTGPLGFRYFFSIRFEHLHPRKTNMEPKNGPSEKDLFLSSI